MTILQVNETTVALLEEALTALGDAEPALRARLLARLAVELYYGSSRERSEALGAEALEVARRSGDQRALTYALNARHVSLWRADERLEIAREMVALAGRAGDREGDLQGRTVGTCRSGGPPSRHCGATLPQLSRSFAKRPGSRRSPAIPMSSSPTRSGW